MDVKEAKRADYVAGLRWLADLLEGNPDLVVPWSGTESSIDVFVETAQELAAWRQVFIEAGPVEMEVTPKDAYPLRLTIPENRIVLGLFSKVIGAEAVA